MLHYTAGTFPEEESVEEDMSIFPLESPLATLHLAGGKGANLSILARAGFRVPPGFIISTDSYREFLKLNQLEPLIQSTLNGLDLSEPQALEQASAAIRSGFKSGRLPAGTQDEIVEAYRQLGKPLVAVRSSATTEDLPGMSFAGQQDTFLNVLSEDDLLKKVVLCWSSLWTARAIGYRAHQSVQTVEVSIAVVVQQMVASDTSGVLFTANPLTGLRSEAVIDATLGLGEGLVSGLVEPDHYVVNTLTREINRKELGAKKVSVRPALSGGVILVTEDGQAKQALNDEQILQLAATGEKVQQLYTYPQDIEWAYNAGQLFLLQSRPITSLFPLPEGMPAEPLKVLFSFGGVQGYLEPITPIGQSALKEVMAAGARLFGVRANEQTQAVVYSAGERLWGNFSALLRNSLGRKVVPIALEYVEPAVGQAVTQVMDDPRLMPERQGVSLKWRLRLAGFFLPVAGNVLLNILSPGKRRKMIVAHGESILENMTRSIKGLPGDRCERLEGLSALLAEFLMEHLPHAFTLFVSGVASGMASLNALNVLSKKTGEEAPAKKGWSELTLQVTRGMPFNPTTEMDLVLWSMAQRIRRDLPSTQAMATNEPELLSRSYLEGRLPAVLSAEVGKFLEIYGGRGFGEIDLGRQRWAEDPAHVFEMLSSFMRIDDEDKAPDVIFARGAESAEAGIERLVSSLRKTEHGFIKSRLARFFAGRVRQLMGMRESPKFFVVRLMWLIRHELLKLGQEFVSAGELDRADDLCYLTFPELHEFSKQNERDWQKVIAERRENYQREQKRRQIPRLFLSDGRAFYEGMNAPGGKQEGSIRGSPVSPGVVEGVVRVVLNPAAAGLLPGEIMVCAGTDPSWTPLFMAAGGLVMEVGGMMTHGAVVAREYGIPAVVGVKDATACLKTGERIRLNGSNGEIVLID